jgi:class 3 adenylate cyclase
MTVGVVCGNCGTEPREGARFCDACGSAVATPPQSPEFKQVTVLFADVVRSMDIASALGTERLREVMSELLSRSRTVVTRFGGTVDFTGDGIMAIFGAPIALEDHAFRGCLAALDLQKQAQSLADELRWRDGIDFSIRVGLNSGEVIAGEMDSSPGSYTAVGAHVGMAQRMESVAPPGGVMMSSSTARLVDSAVEMGALEMVRIKNVEDPVPARRLVSVSMKTPLMRGRRSTLVGRDGELTAICSHMDDARRGNGAVVTLVGPPGIGKSRLIAELVGIGSHRGVETVSAFCEAHAREIPFHVAARMFRDVIGVGELQGRAARDRIHEHLPAVEHEDLLLLHDLFGIGDPEIAPPAIAPDARRRRLTALLKVAAIARTAPVMYVVEDVHWIDEASESLVAEFVSDACSAGALALITYRPEYQGRLADLAAQTIALAPLDGSESGALIDELLGADPSVAVIASQLAERAGGNPFFAEEMVRDLAERGVLAGLPGGYARVGNADDMHVPATLQATIAARIDRLHREAKRTLYGASVIGARFAENQLAAIVDQVRVAELLDAQLIDEVAPAPNAEYAFRHPLIRSVAYESQLQSARAELHARLASALQNQAPESLDEKAALIAMHVEAAGDLRAAFDWHMRAGHWLTFRNIKAARVSWQRARMVAERLPADDPESLRLQIEAGKLLCGSAWRAGLDVAETGFDELRQLCGQLGDDQSLAVGMSGMVMALTFHNRPVEASALASDLVALVERIGDPALTIATLFSAVAAKWETCEVAELRRLAQRMIDLAAEDTAKGNLFVSSPLSLAFAMRGVADMCFGRPGWGTDLDRSISTARSHDPLTRIIATLHKYAHIGLGTVGADSEALENTAESLAIAQHSGDDFTLSHAHLARGIALVAQQGGDRQQGIEHLRRARQTALEGQGNASVVEIADIQLARCRLQAGDLDGAIELSSRVLDDLFGSGAMLWRGPATTVLVDALLSRNADGDLRSAREAIGRLAAVPTDEGYVMHHIPLLRLRALVARAEGDEDGYLSLAQRYRAMSDSCEFAGHSAIAASMT